MSERMEKEAYQGTQEEAWVELVRIDTPEEWETFSRDMGFETPPATFDEVKGAYFDADPNGEVAIPEDAQVGVISPVLVIVHGRVYDEVGAEGRISQDGKRAWIDSETYMNLF